MRLARLSADVVLLVPLACETAEDRVERRQAEQAAIEAQIRVMLADSLDATEIVAVLGEARERELVAVAELMVAAERAAETAANARRSESARTAKILALAARLTFEKWEDADRKTRLWDAAVGDGALENAAERRMAAARIAAVMTPDEVHRFLETDP